MSKEVIEEIPDALADWVADLFHRYLDDCGLSRQAQIGLLGAAVMTLANDEHAEREGLGTADSATPEETQAMVQWETATQRAYGPRLSECLIGLHVHEAALNLGSRLIEVAEVWGPERIKRR